ncbi:hypothetical protein B0H11DRAFT_1914244 [Mycena galericulata]|nr:hypothetical protein B0H11DRAFT_1914244 [Mycena galericulata]
MSPISESSTSLISAALPTSTTKFILITSILACFGFIIHAISPARLTRVLLSALAAAEDSYIQAVEGGSFHHCQYHAATAERLTSQIKPADQRVDSPRGSSARLPLPLVPALSVLQIPPYTRHLAMHPGGSGPGNRHRECGALIARHFKILKEGQIRALSLDASAAGVARTISMRRRL